MSNRSLEPKLHHDAFILLKPSNQQYCPITETVSYIHEQQQEQAKTKTNLPQSHAIAYCSERTD